MLDEIQAILDDAGLLVNWVVSMKEMTQNPYSAGLNINKVLEDLGNYAADLVRKTRNLQKEMQEEFGAEEDKPEEETEKAENASVEQ